MRFIGAGTREGFEYTVRGTFWTVPNVITVLRFLLVPVFILCVAHAEYMTAFWVLAVLSSTDWVDGFVARRFDQMSTVGQWLDPLADRLSLIIVTVTLVGFGVAPAWALPAILIPDLLLFLNAVLLFRGSPELSVSVLGKIRTACLLVATPLILLARTEELSRGVFPTVAESVLAAGCLLHILASLDYFLKAHAKARHLRHEGLAPTRRAQWSVEDNTPS